jgi:hypothetical protein
MKLHSAHLKVASGRRDYKCHANIHVVRKGNAVNVRKGSDIL